MKKNALVIDCLRRQQIKSESGYINRRARLDPTGNWCGHAPDSPRFFNIPEHHKPRPKILIWAQKAWERFYHLPDSYFPELKACRHSPRRRRSESRESMASIAQTLTHHVELSSLRVGVPDPLTGGFRSLTTKFIAKQAGIGLKRAQRVIAEFKKAGYLIVDERFNVQKKQGGARYYGLAAVKRLTPVFFKRGGVSLSELAAHRRFARERLNDAHQKAVRAQEVRALIEAQPELFEGLETPQDYLRRMKEIVSRKASKSYDTPARESRKRQKTISTSVQTQEPKPINRILEKIKENISRGFYPRE